MEWIRVIAKANIESNEGIGTAVVAGHRIAIFCAEGQYYATSDTCTHGNASLSEGYLDGHLIECPLHQGLFDVRTGEAVGPPCTDAVRSFPVKLDDGFICVQID